MKYARWGCPSMLKYFQKQGGNALREKWGKLRSLNRWPLDPLGLIHFARNRKVIQRCEGIDQNRRIRAGMQSTVASFGLTALACFAASCGSSSQAADEGLVTDYVTTPGSVGLGEGEAVGVQSSALQSALNLRALRAHCDFDGDGACDYAYFGIPSGNWNLKKSSNGSTSVQQWGAPEDIPVPNDYDGDGKTDFAVWRPSTGSWAVIYSSNGAIQNPQWGAAADIPVPADYDGDTKADFAIWRPADGTWAVMKSTGAVIINRQWGAAEDIPVPADYDGDGKADVATYRPSSGQWAIILSSTGSQLTPVPFWGAPEDIPVPADYDGDGKADRATWRPSTGNWAIVSSATGAALPGTQWGAPEDIPVPGDWDNDHKADIAIWRPSSGHFAIKKSSGAAPADVAWGAPGDVPVMHLRFRAKPKGDFDGDRRSDLGTFRPSIQQWALRRSALGDSVVISGSPNDIPTNADFDGDGKADIATYTQASGTYRITGSAGASVTTQFGRYDDVPIPGDYDGDRKADIAVYRFSDGNFYIICSSTGVGCGLPWFNGTPVQADYDGDGKTDIAIYRLLSSGAEWDIIRSSNGIGRFVTSSSALAEDVPVPADFDGDGKADIALWRPSTGNWSITNSSTGATTVRQWGNPEDIPVPGDYDGDGKADVAIWRPSTGNWSIIPSSTGVAWANKPWGAPEDMPLVMTVPTRPWWYFLPTLSTIAAPSTIVGDTPVASTTWGSAFWEFSALVAPPGTPGCASGRRFLSGGVGGNYEDLDLLFKSNLTCSGSGCITGIAANDINLLTGWGSGPGGSIVGGDTFPPDNVMTRLPNGNLLLARDALHGAPGPVDTEAIFQSTDCGTTWSLLSFIDPSARAGSAPQFPPPEYPADPNASYGLPQDAAGTAAGGWDREEMYADPFSTSVYVGAGASGGFSPNYADTLLFRSSTSGQTWHSTVFENGYTTVPIMMTSVPNRLYLYTCFGGTPLLHWSNDRGVTLSPGVPLAQGFHCQSSPQSWGVEGDTTISRVSWSSSGDATLRVTFPDLNPNGDQIIRLFTVKVTDGVVTSKYIRSFQVAGSHIMQMTAIQPDVSISPLTTENATLYFWKELSRSGGTMRARGVIMKDETITTNIFDISTVTATGGGSRSWPNSTKTGDYAKGGFSYSSANSRYEYFVPWIEVTAGGVYEMHTKLFGLPH